MKTGAISKESIIQMEPSAVGLFKFLLEGYDNLAYFTVLDKSKGLLKLVYSQDQEEIVLGTLCDINKTIPLEVLP